MYAVKYSIIQNLPVATKTAFLCVSSLSFELHGAAFLEIMKMITATEN